MAIRITHVSTGTYIDMPFSKDAFLLASEQDGSTWTDEFTIEELDDTTEQKVG